MSFATEWARCGPWLAAALAEAGESHTLEDVRRLVVRREAQFWPGPAFAAVTLVQTEPQERRLLIWLAGGELAGLRQTLLPRLEAFARRQGCRRVMIVGRAGWERVLQSQDYAPVARILAKEL